MYIGYMGSIPFYVSHTAMRTMAEVSRSGSARWADHDVIHRKPVSQFIGPGLEELSFKMHLIRDHGVTPDKEINRLREMRDNGMVFPLIMGGKPVSLNYWRLMDISIGETYYNGYGQLIQATVSVSLKEYDDSNYVEEQSQIEFYGKRLNTGLTVLNALGIGVDI